VTSGTVTGGSGVVVTVVIVVVVTLTAEGALTGVFTAGSATGARGGVAGAGACVMPKPAVGTDRTGAGP